MDVATFQDALTVTARGMGAVCFLAALAVPFVPMAKAGRFGRFLIGADLFALAAMLMLGKTHLGGFGYF